MEFLADWRPGCSLDVLRKRAWMLAEIRSYFVRQQVMEVETPVLCQTTGPDPNLESFTAGLVFEGSGYNRPLYLQTSPEFAMKRLLAAGSGSIYQICKAFRNGESGRFHNPEFTILEWYRVGYNLDFLMNDIDDLLTEVLGQRRPNQNSERLGYQQAFLRHCGFDPVNSDLSVFRDYAEDCGESSAMRLCGDNIRLWQEYLFSCRVQPELGKKGLCFVYDYPENQCALARIRPGEPRIAERVEVFYQGVELANGFCELTCPDEQRNRFVHDLEIRSEMGKDLPLIDERFLAALASGLPDCSGVAVGLDRLLMLLVNVLSIDEVVSFSLARA